MLRILTFYLIILYIYYNFKVYSDSYWILVGYAFNILLFIFLLSFPLINSSVKPPIKYINILYLFNFLSHFIIVILFYYFQVLFGHKVCIKSVNFLIFYWDFISILLSCSTRKYYYFIIFTSVCRNFILLKCILVAVILLL